MSGNGDQWDVQYEWKAVLLLMLAFGLVGLDRFAINPLFPAMMKDLNLTYQDLGNLAAVLAIAWGVASAYMGALSDRLGRRKILIPAVIIFSAMSGLTGLASGIGSLLVIRALMGLSEGAFMPASIAATVEASKPTRRGFNFGLQQNGLPLIGLALGPIIVTQVHDFTGSWRSAFWIVALPGFVVAALMFWVLRDTQGAVGSGEPVPHSGENPRWRDVLRIRNVTLACLVLLFTAGALNVVIAMTPSYLVDHLKVETGQMGFIMSATGLGAFAGGIALPALSDRVGRKPVMLVCSAVAVLALWGFMISPADPWLLFPLLAVATGAAFSVIFINNGPLTMESVPAALSSTAVGLVVGVGEVFGGGLAPVLAGYIADHHGIENVFLVSLVLFAACVLLILFIREPARPTRHASAVALAA